MSTLLPELQQGAFQLGSDLASKGQYIDDAVKNLNANLAAIGCEPNVDAMQVRGSWQTIELTPKSPVFTRAVRGAASGIIWRPDSLADSIPPIGSVPVEGNPNAAWVPSSEVDMDELVSQSTEGVLWEDPDEAAYRKSLAATNAELLRGFMGGLASQGYPARRSKVDVREEFYEILDSLALRTSYHCFVEARVIARMMRKSGVSNPLTPYHTLKRYGKAIVSQF